MHADAAESAPVNSSLPSALDRATTPETNKKPGRFATDGREAALGSELTVPALIDKHLCPTIYHEKWWLDICSREQAEVVTIEHKSLVQAQLTFSRIRGHGLTRLVMPTMVHFGGPAFAAAEGSAMHQTQRHHDLTSELLEKLPAADEVSFKLHGGINDTLAFQRVGYRTSVQFTFEIDAAPVPVLWAGIRRGHRRMIRSASERYTVSTATDPEEFVQTYARNISASGKRFRFDQDHLSLLMAETLKRNRGSILLARDATGSIVAGLFTMWDHARTYNFVATRTFGSPDNSPSVMLIWHAIQASAQAGRCFDFDGVFNAGQIQFFTGFGGRITPRYIVTRKSFRAQLLDGLRTVVSKTMGSAGPSEVIF